MRTVPSFHQSVEELLLTADQLVAEDMNGATSAARHRGAALALRTALEICVRGVLDAAVPGLSRRTTGRAMLLCLRCYTEPETARRAKAVWNHLCLGCHYHQYEMGPTRDQIRIWRAEVEDLVHELMA